MTTLDRRHFLKLLGLGIPAAVIEHRLGFWERLRAYSFGPQIRVATDAEVLKYASQAPRLLKSSDIAALELEKIRHLLPALLENYRALDLHFKQQAVLTSARQIRYFCGAH